ncbi:MAG: PBECR2 nuclease fold domain-containing protein [Oscillospiraceae bacterium]
MAVDDVHYIGKIDVSIYKCVSEEIVTDEVIITDERIQHIKDRHPNDFERYCGYMSEIIEQPDYIIEANKPNSALILKDFSSGEERFKTILRLVTSNDDPAFKNSIITFMKIDESEWKRLINNKKVLYKRE